MKIDQNICLDIKSDDFEITWGHKLGHLVNELGHHVK